MAAVIEAPKVDWGRYLGIPYAVGQDQLDGCDCWGLVSLIFRDELGIEVPSIPEMYDILNTPIAMIEHAERNRWLKCKPHRFAVLLLRLEGDPKHVGVCIDGEKFIHTTIDMGPRIERIESRFWRMNYLGCYEWIG